MVAFQQGDENAFACLFDRYAKPLTSYFYRRAYDKHLADDLCQETFIRIVKSAHRYRPEATFRTFLYAVARNLLIDHIRSKKSAPKMVSADQRVGDDGATVGDLVASRGRETVDALADREAAAMIRDAVRGLPEIQREVYELVDAQGLKYREIAALLEIPVGTVKSRMNAALTSLRGLLKRVLS